MLMNIRGHIIEHLEQNARAEEAKAGKTFRRSGKHARAADRLNRRAAKMRARQERKQGGDDR